MDVAAAFMWILLIARACMCCVGYPVAKEKYIMMFSLDIESRMVLPFCSLYEEGW